MGLFGFDYDTAKEDMWDEGLDPDALPDNDPKRRDEYLRSCGMDPDRYKYGTDDPASTRGSGQPDNFSLCFLTTACTAARGLPDDCMELQTLRAFRDGWLTEQPQGKQEIAHYYAAATGIVARIDALPQAQEIWERLYTQLVLPCVEDIQAGRFESAYVRYKSCVLELEKGYGEVRT